MEENQNALLKLKEMQERSIIEYLEEASNIVSEVLKYEDEPLVESDFIKYFLPLLKGDIEPNEENIKTYIENMYNATGSYYRGIKVIDDKTKEELFVLPPIMLDIDPDSIVAKNVDYYKMVNMFKQISDNNPFEAEKFLGKATEGIAKATKPDEEQLKKYLDGVVKMFKRYNINFESNEKSKNKETLKQTEPEDSISDFLDYE